ncbi:MAG: hypothetical protein ACERJ2_19025, partial [Filomicrobium sp.]
MKFVYTGMQRCGTKSFGDFFRKNGYRVFSWSETVTTDLHGLFADGKWLDILNSGIFNDYDVFEDAPFSDPVFARF